MKNFSFINSLTFKTRKKVFSFEGGQYKSYFKGSGIEFSDIKEYNSGDDIRYIDWKLLAKTGTPYIKVFIEEKALTVFLLVDLSQSNSFGRQLKSQLISSLVEIICLSCLNQQILLGALFCNGEEASLFPARRGKKHIFFLWEKFKNFPIKGEVSLKKQIEKFFKYQKRKVLCFLISDFMTGNYQESLKIIKRKHDLLVFRIGDILERDFSLFPYVSFQDSETGEYHSFSKKIFKKIQKKQEGFLQEQEEFFHREQINFIDLTAQNNWLEKLKRFFARYP